MADESKLKAQVQIKDLTIGDRFMSGDALWTITGFDDDYYTARKHSTESRSLGMRGYGYHGDPICSFPKKEKVVFIPVADEQVKAETAGLRDRLAKLEAAVKAIDAYWESGNFSRDAGLWQMLKDALKENK